VCQVLVWLVVALCFNPLHAKKAGQKALEDVSDIKEFKKLLKTRTSVLVVFTKSTKEASQLTKVLVEVADIVRGTGTIVSVDCGG
jgi:protein disulfide-isomerase A5